MTVNKDQTAAAGYNKGQFFGAFDRKYGCRFNDKGATVYQGAWQRKVYLLSWAKGYRAAYWGLKATKKGE